MYEYYMSERGCVLVGKRVYEQFMSEHEWIYMSMNVYMNEFVFNDLFIYVSVPDLTQVTYLIAKLA